jgi:hypothetical protein
MEKHIIEIFNSVLFFLWVFINFLIFFNLIKKFVKVK